MVVTQCALICRIASALFGYWQELFANFRELIDGL